MEVPYRVIQGPLLSLRVANILAYVFSFGYECGHAPNLLHLLLIAGLRLTRKYLVPTAREIAAHSAVEHATYVLEQNFARLNRVLKGPGKKSFKTAKKKLKILLLIVVADLIRDPPAVQEGVSDDGRLIFEFQQNFATSE